MAIATIAAMTPSMGIIVTLITLYQGYVHRSPYIIGLAATLAVVIWRTYEKLHYLGDLYFDRARRYQKQEKLQG
jgi:hypothetical protein